MLSALASKVKEYSEKNGLPVSDNIIVGLSGGPDSVCLLSVLCELSREDASFPKLYAFHLNHGLRGDEALRDEKIAGDVCEALGVPLKTAHEDIRSRAAELKRGEEETGRIVRYDLMHEFASSLEGSSVIAVAHHRGDMAETFMMNIFRGSGLEGLVAPRPVSGDIIRPLLFCSKDEILAYLKERGLPYGTDSTNLDNDYTRNMWRNEIFPLISKVSVKTPGDAIADTYDLLSDDLSYIEQTVGSLYDEDSVELQGLLFYPVRSIASLHPAIAKRIIRLLWKKTFGDLVDFEKIHTDKVYEGCLGGGSFPLDMPFGRKAGTVRGLLYFEDKDVAGRADRAVALSEGLILCDTPICITIGPFDQKNTLLPQTDIQISTEIIENIAAVRYNTKSWFVPVTGDGRSFQIRNDAAGFYFKKAGSSAGKALRRVFSDLKIPSSLRSKVVAVTSGDSVLWIPGIGHAEGFVSGPSKEAHLKSIDKKPLHYLKVTIEGGQSS